MKKFVRDRLDELRSNWVEVGRAKKQGDLVPAYDPQLFYSLSSGGNVYQAMTFRKGEWTGGSAWHLVATQVTPEEFQERYESLDFQVVIREEPKPIRYDKQILVGRESKIPPNLELQARVLQLRLDGLSYMKIEKELGVEGKKGFYAMKILRAAQKDTI